MKTWPIWSEGYAATGDSSDATYHGEWPGETFRDACVAWSKSCAAPQLFDAERLTYWGCRLFASEAEARATFG